MEIGTERPAIVIEPIESPVPTEEPAAPEEPVEVPERERETEPEKVPA